MNKSCLIVPVEMPRLSYLSCGHENLYIVSTFKAEKIFQNKLT